MKKTVLISAVALVLLLVGYTVVGAIMDNVEQPKYQVLSAKGKIEIRQYQPILIAEVDVKGERKAAISQGFRQLADFIFGNNVAQKKVDMTAPVQQQANEKIAMTAPVQQQANEKIAMTAPVQQQVNEKIAMTAPVQQTGGSMSWKVSFVMPSAYTADSLPQPKNAQIRIKSIPSKQYVVIRFSGRNTDNNIARYRAQLDQFVHKKQLKTVGKPKYAFYNPPWTLPFMRRNEIMIELKS